jgi:hypothetical protein
MSEGIHGTKQRHARQTRTCCREALHMEIRQGIKGVAQSWLLPRGSRLRHYSDERRRQTAIAAHKQSQAQAVTSTCKGNTA